MNPTEILLMASNLLNNLGIKYMLVGADAVNFYGRPRTTHDSRYPFLASMAIFILLDFAYEN